MGNQPALIQFDWRPATANLYKFPRKLRLQNGLPTVPSIKLVRIDEVEVFVVLAADHCIFAVDLAGEESHAFVSRGRSLERLTSLNEMKSLVSISSDRIAIPV